MSKKDIKDEIYVDDVIESFEYVYLVQTAIIKNNHGHQIYKFGKTSRLHTRFNRYPKGTQIYLLKRVKNCGFVEDEIKRLFGKYFTQELSHGYEYFSGDVKKMIDCIEKIIKASNQEVEDTDIKTKIRSYYRDRIIMAVGKHDAYEDPCFDAVDDNNIIKADAIESETESGGGGCVNDVENIETPVIVKKKKNITDFVCDKCGKIFKSNQALKYHTENKSCQKHDYKYNCEYCRKGFTTDSSMYRHRKYSCGEKNKITMKEEDKEIFERLLVLEENNKLLVKRSKKAEDDNQMLKKEIKKLTKQKNIVNIIGNVNTNNVSRDMNMNTHINNDTANRDTLATSGLEDMTKRVD